MPEISSHDVEGVTEAFAAAFQEKFPEATIETHLEEMDGFHAWLLLTLPSGQERKYREALDYSGKLTDRFWGTGVWLVGIVVRSKKEPVHG